MSAEGSNLILRTRLSAVQKEQGALVDELFQIIDQYEREMVILKLEKEHERDLYVRNQELLETMISRAEGLDYMLSQNAFVVVLIDGDGAIFLDELLQKPEDGAKEAAQRLKQAVRASLDATVVNKDNVRILAHIFVNVKKLARTLRNSNIIASRKDLTIFAEHFTDSYPELNFINVGPGKKSAEFKMGKMLHYYYHQSQCKKIFFIGCHKHSYLHDLTPYLLYPGSEDKITLVETTPAHQQFHSLPFPIIQFNDIFRSDPIPNEEQPSNASTPQTPNQPTNPA